MIYIFAVFGVLYGGVICLYFYGQKEKLIFKEYKLLCKDCHHPFKIRDIIPIFSYLVHGGRCPYCKKRKNAMYFYIPILNGYGSTLLYFLQEDVTYGVLFGLIHTLLLCMVVMDVYHQEIKNNFFVFLLALGILLSVYQKEILFYERAIALGMGAIPFLLLSSVFKNKIGSGDGLLLGILGFIIGVEGIVVVIVFGYIAASVYSLFLLIRKKAHRKTKIAMFPFFYLAFMAYFLYASWIHQYFSIALF